MDSGESSTSNDQRTRQPFHGNQPHTMNRLPKVDMNKFNVSNPTRWVSQIEHYFSLQRIDDGQLKL
jgi:hypothetical protein